MFLVWVLVTSCENREYMPVQVTFTTSLRETSRKNKICSTAYSTRKPIEKKKSEQATFYIKWGKSRFRPTVDRYPWGIHHPTRRRDKAEQKIIKFTDKTITKSTGNKFRLSTWFKGIRHAICYLFKRLKCVFVKLIEFQKKCFSFVI